MSRMPRRSNSSAGNHATPGTNTTARQKGATMRIVVTGSSGRIGQHVVKELAEHDYEVIATDLARAPTDLPRGVQYVQGDMMAAADAAGVLAFRGRKPDAVIHLAAIPSPVRHTME